VKIGGQKAPCAEVIGVTRTRRGGPLDTDPIPEAFVLLGSAAEPPNLAAMFPGSAIALRVDGDPARVIPASQRALQELLPDIPSLRVRPALSLFDRSVRALRLGATMFTMFGAIALVLAIVGMYGTVAYLVAQRTREIGIRMALGATVRDIALAVFGETARMTLAGLTLGVLLGAVVARAMGALLFGISPLSPGVYAAACLALFGAALAASALPARQAMRVEPMVALRAE
jgi:ABC-type antimicrobial peptide transport system permease subunit